jgi:hypothetical protein
MSDTLHTFAPLSSHPGRGTHLITTQDHDEALALTSAFKLRRSLRDLTSWSETIVESLLQTHGEGKVTGAIRTAFAKAEEVLSKAGEGA